MDKSMKEIIDMHSKISNDPWIHHRQVKLQQDLELKQCMDDKRRLENLTWYSKLNTNAQMDRFLWLQRKECEMLKDMQMKETDMKTRQNNEHLENLMGKYMEKEKNDSLHLDRYSQYLRDNDPSLRLLATQLREAYVGKMRLAQIDEKEKLKNEIATIDVPFVREMARLKKAEEEQEKLNIFLEEEKKYHFRKQLEHQMKEKAYYDSLNDTREEDKIRIEAIIKDNMEKIQEEKDKEMAKKALLKKSYMDAFKLREEELLKEKQRLLDEEEKFKMLSKDKEYRNEALLQQKRLREENLNKIQKRLGDLLSEKQRENDEFEAARQDVAIAQSEMQAFRHEQIERQNKENAKREYVAELNKFKEYAREAERNQKIEDQKLDKEIERLQNLKEEEYKLRALERERLNEKFKKECQENIKEKILEKERCHEDEIKLEKSYIQDNEKYKEDVERERMAMIREMAPHLYPGCIPRGMLRENDIQLLDDPLKNFLLTKKSYPDLDAD